MADPLPPGLVESSNRRYRIVAPKPGAAVRSGWFARDTVTGGSVFIKAGPRSAILREYSVLLALPPGLSARARDLVPIDAQRLGLVQERLAGRTWMEAEPDLGREDVPRLVLDLCDRLSGLHRLGLSHTDLKPSNLFLLDGSAGETRLLDLASARSAGAGETPDEGEHEPDVTAPFAAPELLRGWAADTRVDQYSLGMILRRMPGLLSAQPAWGVIVDRLTRPAPSGRFADLAEVREEILARFGIADTSPVPPRFPAGPLRGRAAELDEVRRWAGDPAASPVLLVQARAGIGLTRFLRESLAAVIRAEGSPVQMVEFPASGGPADPATAEAAVILAERAIAAGSRVLLGVPDPGPGLRWLIGAGADRLRVFVAGHGVTRLLLQPVGAAAWQDITATSLGAGGSATEALGAALFAKAEGDLRASAEGFAVACAGSGSERGIAWTLDETKTLAAIEAWPAPELSPRTEDLPGDLREPLQILARAGLVVHGGQARDLLARFGYPDVLGRLLELGVLHETEGTRLRFVHRQLRESARSRPLAISRPVEEWLCARLAPDPHDTTHVLEAAARARELADPARERAILVAALEPAVREQRWGDVRRLLEHPSGGWTEEDAPRRAAAIHATLGRAWPTARILRIAAECFSSQGLPLGPKLLAEVAREPRTVEGYESLVLLTSGHGTAARMDEYARGLRLVEEIEAGGAEPVPGLAALERARWCAMHGKRAEARELVEQASRRLQGSGRPQEIETYSFAASAAMPDHPEVAIGWLLRGLQRTQVPVFRSMLHRVLASIFEYLGDAKEFERNAEASLDDLAGGEYPRHFVHLRTQRAWAWAARDRVREAQSEAMDLLQSPILQSDPQRRNFVIILAGCTALQQGHGRTAIQRLASAWEAFDPKLPPFARARGLRYLLDALLDLRAWPVVREHADSLTIPDGSPEATARMTRARAGALQAQAAGSDEKAYSLLADLTETARAQPGVLDSARYLHHLGEAALGFDPGTAAGHFRESHDRFGTDGYGYLRSRSLLGLARAQRHADPRQSRGTLEETIALARSIDARGVLAEALRLRAEWGLATA